MHYIFFEISIFEIRYKMAEVYKVQKGDKIANLNFVSFKDTLVNMKLYGILLELLQFIFWIHLSWFLTGNSCYLIIKDRGCKNYEFNTQMNRTSPLIKMTEKRPKIFSVFTVKVYFHFSSFPLLYICIVEQILYSRKLPYMRMWI